MRLWQLAREAADAAWQGRVRLADVEAVMARHGIDEYGLGKLDRAVIRALLTQPWRVREGKEQRLVGYKMAEEMLCAMAGVDSETYRTEVKPRLAARQWLSVRGGQVLSLECARIYEPRLTGL